MDFDNIKHIKWTGTIITLFGALSFRRRTAVLESETAVLESETASGPKTDAKNDGICILFSSAIDLTIKFGALPIYVNAPKNTDALEIANKVCGKVFIKTSAFPPAALKNTKYDSFILDYYKNHLTELDDPKHGINLNIYELNKYLIRPDIWGPAGVIYYISRV